MASLPDENTETPVLSGQGDLKSDVRLLAYQVRASRQKNSTGFSMRSKTTMRRKSELKGLKEDVDKLNANIGWLVKIIIGAVVIAVLGLVIVKGGIAPR